MHKDESYRVLRQRMSEVQSLGYESLLTLVNENVISEPVQIQNEEVWIDVAVVWADKSRRTLYVVGSASGPNCWRMERLEEKVLLSPDEPAADEGVTE